MESFNDLATKDYTYADMLRYYKNIWNRNLVARTIDMQTDITLKAADAEQLVQHENQMIPVKERLEHRKIMVQDALDLIAGIDALLALTVEQYTAQVLSKDALAVAADMLPPAPKAGDVCDIDGKAGTLQDDGTGTLVCVATEVAAAPAEAAPAPKVEDAGEKPAPEATV